MPSFYKKEMACQLPADCLNDIFEYLEHTFMPTS